MNISFDVKNVQLPNKPDDTIKKEINFFKLHVEKDYRYISDFEIYPDDNCIMCYTEDNEIELTYKDNTISDIECYNQEKITQDLYNLIDERKTISENLIMFNDYFDIYVGLVSGKEDVYKNVFNFPSMNREEKFFHVAMLERLLDKQKVLYTRLSLSDDPEAKKMKQNILDSAQLMGLSSDVDMNVIFNNMTKMLGIMRNQIDKN